ncbi:MAG: rhodanese-like domain-containing protein [Candidatus Dormibacteraeota bacterium]|nr:rhodanese-like domain-containing protein [Candidatus Dormibacteraeota bacterium]
MFGIFRRWSVPAVTIDEFAELHRKGCFVVDVRQPHEYMHGHVPGAHSVPLTELARRAPELAERGPVHVICATGHRSRVAARLLVGRGVEAVSVHGGTSAWHRRRLPLISGRHPGRR